MKFLYTKKKRNPTAALTCVCGDKYEEYSVPPSDDASAASNEASRLKEERLSTYFDLVCDLVEPWTGTVPKQQEYESYATKVLQNNNHYLTRLANNSLDVRDALEDYQTCRHNYFFSDRTPTCAKDLYTTYVPKFNGAVLVVLRIRDSELVKNLHQDPSESNGFRTPDHISAELFEVMEDHKDFALEHYRKNDNNWKPLAKLV